jgi:hypothetical protein
MDYICRLSTHEQTNIKLGGNSSKDTLLKINGPDHFKELSNGQQVRRRTNSQQVLRRSRVIILQDGAPNLSRTLSPRTNFVPLVIFLLIS